MPEGSKGGDGQKGKQVEFQIAKRPEPKSGWLYKKCFWGYEKRFCAIDARLFRFTWSPSDDRNNGGPSLARRLRANFTGNIGTGFLDLRLATADFNTDNDNERKQRKHFIIVQPHKTTHLRARDTREAAAWIQAIEEWHEYFLHRNERLASRKSTIRKTAGK